MGIFDKPKNAFLCFLPRQSCLFIKNKQSADYILVDVDPQIFLKKVKKT